MASGKWTLCEAKRERIIYANLGKPCCPCVVYRVHNDGPAAVIAGRSIHIDPGEDGDISGPKIDLALTKVLCPPGSKANEQTARGTYDLLSCCCVCGTSSATKTTPPPCSRHLGMNEQHQQQTEWCWSATSVSISLFYNPASTWTQCTLVNQAFGQTTCCQNGGSAACNNPWFPEKALAITGNLKTWVGSSEPFSTVMTEIDAGRPISIAIYWFGGGGHNPAIDGYDNCNPAAPTIDIEDPWYGPSTQDFNSFPHTYNGGANWGNTYFTT